MIEFELLNSNKGLIISGDKFKYYYRPSKCSWQLWHDLVEHSYDPLANGWEDELIAVGRQLLIEQLPFQINTHYFLKYTPNIIKSNISALCYHKSNIRKCPYQFSNKQQTKLRFIINKTLKPYMTQLDTNYCYIYPLSLEKYTNIANWLIYGAISFKEQYPLVNLYKTEKVIRQLSNLVNSIKSDTTKVKGLIDLNASKVTWELI